MTSAHATLSGSDVHEPKGISGATPGQIYIADGAGSGSWQPSSNSFTTTIRTYTNSGTTDATSTWTKPSNCIGVEFILVGGGSGFDTNGAQATGGSSSKFHTAIGTGASNSSAGTGTGGQWNLTGTGEATDAGGGKPAYIFAELPSARYGYGNNNSSFARTTYGGGATLGFFTASTLSATETVTVGTGGIPTQNGGINGFVWLKEYTRV